MQAGYFNFYGSLIALSVFGMMGHFFSQRIHGEENGIAYRSYLGWMGRGLLAPVLLWMVFNSGLLPKVPALDSAAEFAFSKGGKGVGLWLGAISGGLLVIGSLWATLTYGWQLVDLSEKLKDQRQLIRKAVFWLVLTSPLSALIVFAFHWEGIGFAAVVWLAPLVHFALPLTEQPRKIPMYSRAIGSLKRGKYKAAEAQILDQLERCEDDFEGWMLLADLYAHQYHDLPESDRTVRELCNQPNITPVQISLALHRLADWHLKLADDPLSARRALEEISRCFPGTHIDRMARLRFNQIPTSREALIEQRQVKPVRLPALKDPLDVGTPVPPVDPAVAMSRAKRWVVTLEQNPNDIEAREALAILMAEQMGQVEQALEQLKLLMEMPDPPEKKRAEWLGLMASWQLNYRHDIQTARPLLERLVHEYPQSIQAFAAQRHLNDLDWEERNRRTHAAGSP